MTPPLPPGADPGSLQIQVLVREHPETLSLVLARTEPAQGADVVRDVLDDGAVEAVRREIEWRRSES